MASLLRRSTRELATLTFCCEPVARLSEQKLTVAKVRLHHDNRT